MVNRSDFLDLDTYIVNSYLAAVLFYVSGQWISEGYIFI